MKKSIRAAELPRNNAQRIALENKIRIEVFTDKAKNLSACLGLFAFAFFVPIDNAVEAMGFAVFCAFCIILNDNIGDIVQRRIESEYVEVE